MSEADPFNEWDEDYKLAQAGSTAQLVKHFHACEHRARRNLNEALTYYESGQWKLDGIESERIDKLLNDLRQRMDDAHKICAQSQDRLDAILTSQRRFTGQSITERRDELLRTAKPLETSDEVAPTPLEAFLTNQSEDEPERPRRKSRSL